MKVLLTAFSIMTFALSASASGDLYPMSYKCSHENYNIKLVILSELSAQVSGNKWAQVYNGTPRGKGQAFENQVTFSGNDFFMAIPNTIMISGASQELITYDNGGYQMLCIRDK